MTAVAVIAMITEIAKLLQTAPGQELLKDLVAGGEKATGIVEKLGEKIAGLFHHQPPTS